MTERKWIKVKKFIVNAEHMTRAMTETQRQIVNLFNEINRLQKKRKHVVRSARNQQVATRKKKHGRATRTSR